MKTVDWRILMTSLGAIKRLILDENLALLRLGVNTAILTLSPNIELERFDIFVKIYVNCSLFEKLVSTA